MGCASSNLVAPISPPSTAGPSAASAPPSSTEGAAVGWAASGAGRLSTDGRRKAGPGGSSSSSSSSSAAAAANANAAGSSSSQASSPGGGTASGGAGAGVSAGAPAGAPAGISTSGGAAGSGLESSGKTTPSVSGMGQPHTQQPGSGNGGGTASASSMPETVRAFAAKVWIANATSSLRAIIASPQARDALADFLRTEYSEHNLDFFVAAQHYRSSVASGTKTPAELAAEMADIFRDYLGLEAQKEVNVSSTVRALAAGGSPQDLVKALDRAEAEVLSMMSLDTFPRFLRSRHMADLQASLLAAREEAQALAHEQHEKHAADTAAAAAAAAAASAAALAASGDNSLYDSRRDSVSSLLTLISAAQANLAAPSAASSSDSSSARSTQSAGSAAPWASNTPAAVAVGSLQQASRRWLDAFVAVADLLPACVVISDMSLPDYPMVFVNSAFCQTSGYTKEECTGRNCRFLQGPDTSQATVELIRKALRTGRELHCDILNYKKGGAAFRNFLSLRPVWQELSDAEWDAAESAVRAGAPGTILEGTMRHGGALEWGQAAAAAGGAAGSPSPTSSSTGPSAPAATAGAPAGEAPAGGAGPAPDPLRTAASRGPVLLRIIPFSAAMAAAAAKKAAAEAAKAGAGAVVAAGGPDSPSSSSSSSAAPSYVLPPSAVLRAQEEDEEGEGDVAGAGLAGLEGRGTGRIREEEEGEEEDALDAGGMARLPAPTLRASSFSTNLRGGGGANSSKAFASRDSRGDSGGASDGASASASASGSGSGAGSTFYSSRVGAALRTAKGARLAFFIGVQFEIAAGEGGNSARGGVGGGEGGPGAIVPQRLLQHNALLRTLPLTVGL